VQGAVREKHSDFMCRPFFFNNLKHNIMKEKLLEIQTYFIEQLVAGKFQIIRFTEKYLEVTVRIDDEYYFSYKLDFKDISSIEQVQSSSDKNFMLLPELDYDSKFAFIEHFTHLKPQTKSNAVS
jgi:hypothetical protein